MNEFSPGVGIDLKAMLDIVQNHSGDRGAQRTEIAASVPKIAKTEVNQRLNRANNVLIGMSQCGLYDLETHSLTRVGLELQAIPTDSVRTMRFARHLIVECHGEELIDAVEMIRDRGEQLTLQAIRKELRSRGYDVTENASDAAKLRMWLEIAGVIDSSWTVDARMLESIVGVTTSGLAAWRALPRPQRALIAVLLELEGDAAGWVTGRHVKRLTELSYGREVFPEGRLRKDVLDPLESAGWIEVRGKGTGRGGDSGDLRATNQLTSVKLALDVDRTSGIPVDLRKYLATPLPRIFDDLKSPSTHVKGLALELLALRLIRDLGLYPVAFRLRSATTQGAEVDLVADGLHLHYSRWLFQCKNTAVVHVNDIAKEVGMAIVLKAQVIVLVTTGRFAGPVETYANGLAESSALQAILIDNKVLAGYRANGGVAVVDHLRRGARNVLRLKAPQAALTEGIQ